MAFNWCSCNCLIMKKRGNNTHRYGSCCAWEWQRSCTDELQPPQLLSEVLHLQHAGILQGGGRSTDSRWIGPSAAHQDEGAETENVSRLNFIHIKQGKFVTLGHEAQMTWSPMVSSNTQNKIRSFHTQKKMFWATVAAGKCLFMFVLQWGSSFFASFLQSCPEISFEGGHSYFATSLRCG